MTEQHQLDCVRTVLSTDEEEPFRPFGEKLCSVKGVDFYLLSFTTAVDGYDFPVLKLLAVNNSSRDVWINSCNATRINAGKVNWIDYGFFDRTVPAGCASISNFNISGDVTYEEINQIHFRLAVHDLYTNQLIGKTKTMEVTIS